MESTGVYWKPVYAILEGALEIVVANARHVKKVPGRMLRVIDLRLLALFFFSKFVVSNHGKSKFSFAPRRVYISEHLAGKRNKARKMDVRRRALSTVIWSSWIKSNSPSPHQTIAVVIEKCTIFNRIQFWRIGGEKLHPQSPTLFADELPGRATATSRPDHPRQSADCRECGALN